MRPGASGAYRRIWFNKVPHCYFFGKIKEKGAVRQKGITYPPIHWCLTLLVNMNKLPLGREGEQAILLRVEIFYDYEFCILVSCLPSKIKSHRL